MKKQTIFLIALLIIIALMLTGCISSNQPGSGQPEPTETPKPTVQPTAEPEATTMPPDDIDTEDEDVAEPEDQDQETETGSGSNEQGSDTGNKPSSKPSDVLTRMLPEKAGFKWVYNGTAEYGHELVLEDIREEDDKIIYSAKGQVFDMSDGESGQDFSLAVNYIVTSDRIIQTKTGNMSMEEFDRIELIKLPLEVGNTWIQKVKDKDGKEHILECTIVKAELVAGFVREFTVKYLEKNGSYYEERVIRDYIGVMGYRKPFAAEDGGYYDELVYWLYDSASGYGR